MINAYGLTHIALAVKARNAQSNRSVTFQQQPSADFNHPKFA